MINIRDLIDWLNARQAEYDAGHPTVSDEEYDEMYFKLVMLEGLLQEFYPDSPTQKIHYETKSALETVTHNHLMLSLDKTKDWDSFCNYFTKIDSSKDVVLMQKLDGLTLSLCYEEGKLISAETRGDGEKGEDVLHNAMVISSIPKKIKYKDRLVIDGEVVCSYENFEQFNSQYANPRNFASGSIRLLDAKECGRRNLTFLAWYVVEGLGDSLVENFNQLIDFGFHVVPWLTEMSEEGRDYLRKKVDYPIDGLVARFDSREFAESLGSTGHHPKGAYAFKFYEESAWTKLKEIVWQVGRGEALTPVAVFEPIELEGTTVDRASLHNYSVMKELLGECPYENEPIEVYKAHEIIPQIRSAERLDKESILAQNLTIIDGFAKDGSIQCPECNSYMQVVVNDSGVENVCCLNPECEGKLVNRIDHFVGKKGLDIKGLSKATIEKLINWGWLNNIEDVFSLVSYQAEWEDKDGFGEKSVQKILDAIEEGKNCTLEKFISSLGIHLIGERVAKEIVKHVSSWEEFRQLVDDGFNFAEWDSFGTEKAYYLSTYNYSLADSLVKYCNIQNSSKQESQDLLNKVFCITGKLINFKNRTELQSIIEEKGGKVTSSVSSNTDYLINNDVASESSKNKRAKELNIPIISEEEFIKNFLDI